ncbi:MAG: small-conductance mechanosensitive channel [Clostridiaceae bacterium]|nr:small-conductance mechanosensitive channel [Clostridiaceae bacterium]
MQEFLKQVYLNNTVSRYLWALGTFLLSLLVISLLKNLILKRLFHWITKRTGEQDTKLLYLVNKYLLMTMYLSAFYISEKIIYKAPLLKKIIDTCSLALFVYLIVVFATAFLEFGLNKYSDKFGDDTGRRIAFQWITKSLKAIIWIIAIILFVQNLGVQIGALVTGLGVGGVAIAFAAQTILGEIFSYFTIFFDRPFEVGDFINTGEFSGSVEHIGLRTTKLRSIGGEQLIFSNKDLTNSRVKNYKRMDERRVSFNLSVVYNTPNEKLKMIPSTLKEIIEAEPDTRFDRAHFSAYTEYSLKFDVVYYYLSSDYNGYMDTQQRINFGIKDFFENNHINFAYPTQTILYNEDKINQI